MGNNEKDGFRRVFKKPIPQTVGDILKEETEVRDKNYKDGDDFTIENAVLEKLGETPIPESLVSSIKNIDDRNGLSVDEIREAFVDLEAEYQRKKPLSAELKVPQMLRDAAKIYEDRNKIYGDNYKHFGFVFKELFPNGLEVKTPKDFNRLGILVQMVAKMTRYVANFNKGGHADSLDDLAVYTMMLRELDIDD